MLTYRRKREALMEWMDQNARPLAFLDNDEVLGVQIGSQATRLRVDGRSLLVQVGSPGASAELLEDAIQGVFDVLVPRETLVRDYRGLWSVGIEGEYAELAGKLARRAAPIDQSATLPAFDVVDGALLIDLTDGFGTYQVEFGVVTPTEIRERVGRQVAGRVARGSQMLLPVNKIPGDVPPVSLYMDVHFKDVQQDDLQSAAELIERFEATEKRVTRLARELAGTL